MEKRALGPRSFLSALIPKIVAIGPTDCRDRRSEHEKSTDSSMARSSALGAAPARFVGIGIIAEPRSLGPEGAEGELRLSLGWWLRFGANRSALRHHSGRCLRREVRVGRKCDYSSMLRSHCLRRFSRSDGGYPGGVFALSKSAAKSMMRF